MKREPAYCPAYLLREAEAAFDKARAAYDRQVQSRGCPTLATLAHYDNACEALVNAKRLVVDTHEGAEAQARFERDMEAKRTHDRAWKKGDRDPILDLLNGLVEQDPILAMMAGAQQ